MMLNFTIKNDGNVYTGYLTGRLDTESAGQFEKAIKPLLAKADKEIIIDCAKLEYVSSAGLRQLLALRKAVAAKGGKFTMVNVSYYIESVLKMTGMMSLFEIRK